MKRLGIAVAGAVLAAGLAGGTGFAAVGGGFNGIGSHVAGCATLQARIAELAGLQRAAAATGNTARVNQLAAQILRLQTRFTKQCVTVLP
jgi:hypothetical protein